MHKANVPLLGVEKWLPEVPYLLSDSSQARPTPRQHNAPLFSDEERLLIVGHDSIQVVFGRALPENGQAPEPNISPRHRNLFHKWQLKPAGMRMNKNLAHFPPDTLDSQC